MLLLAVVALLGVLSAGGSAAAARPGCATWTRFGALGNQTGQPVVMWDRDGAVPRQLVAVGGAVSFRESFPARVRRHIDWLSYRSLDFSGGVHPVHGWLVTGIPVNVVRPDSCRG